MINNAILAIFPKIKKLSELQIDIQKNTIASEYKSISNGKFVEKRDNQIFYVELDKNVTFREQEVEYLSKTFFLKNGQRLDIDCSKGLTNLEVRINNQIIKLGDTLSLQNIKDMELAEAFSKDIRENIKRIPKDYESQTINELYTSTLSAVMSLVQSDNIKQDTEIYRMLEGNSKKIQEIRTEMIEQNNSKAVVIFEE